MNAYKVYIIGGKEYFQALAGDGDGQPICLPLGESLLRFLELDMSGRAGAQPFSGHPYLALAGRHSPARIIALQRQMRELAAAVFSNPRGKEKAMDRLAQYCRGGTEGKFTLGPITTCYEIIGDSGLCEILEPKSIGDILNFVIRAMAKANVSYKSCLHCGKYFLPGHGNAKFCERRIDATEKTCRDIGALRLYREKQKHSPVLVEYERAYNCYQKSYFGRDSHVELFRFVHEEIHVKFGGQCKVIITYNDCPLVREQAEKYGFYLYTQDRLHNMAQQTDPGSLFTEVIITNYDALEVMNRKAFLRSREMDQLSLFPEGGLC